MPLPTRSHACTVLVVEDDPLLRLDAMDLVADAGFAVAEAANADQALRLLERDTTIGVLFTDVDMPGSMDGLSLAHLVRRRWPGVAIMVASGHLKGERTALPAGGQFFAKPYRPAHFQAVLARLAGPAPRAVAA